MTSPQRPGDLPQDAPLAAVRGWDDERLEAAFAARAARAIVPVDLVPATVERLRPTPEPGRWWRRLLPAGAVALLLVAVVGGGIALLGGSTGVFGTAQGVAFRDGPTAELRTLDAGTFALDFPADWHGYDATGRFEGPSLAVLSSVPIPCGSGDAIDITCVYERPLEPGEARVVVGVLPYRSGSVLDRLDIEDGTTTRLSIGGMPAILDERDETPDDFYLADDTATWSIGTPESLARAVQLDFHAREPEVGVARAAADAIAASLRFTPPPTPLPDDPVAAVTAARAALDAVAAVFRQGFVRAGQPDDLITYMDCLPAAPGEDRVIGIDYGPGGDLGWSVLTQCRWTVVADERGPFWRIDTVYEWTVGEDFGRYRESLWIDAAGLVVGRTSSGDAPPAGDPFATPAPTPTPAPTTPAWGPWPPDGSEVIELANDDPNDPARVAIVDPSGELVDVRAATAQDGRFDGPDEGFFRDPTGDGRYRLRWGTTICDREMTVTIDADVDRIVIDHAPRDGCDAMGIGRELVLELSRDIDPASVELVVNRAVLLPDVVSTDVPAELFGLEVIDVEAALEIQAPSDDDREIAVRGWLQASARRGCGIMPVTSVIEPRCPGAWLGATQGAEGPFVVATHLPLWEMLRDAGSGGSLSSDLVAIGHFDDRRSSDCETAMEAACRDVFWIDTVWVAGEPIARDWIFSPPDDAMPAPPVGTADDAAAITRMVFDDPAWLIEHDAWVLSVGLMPGSELVMVEPSMRPTCMTPCDALVQVPSWIWHVTVLDRTTSEVRTFVVDDAEFGDAGPVVVHETTIDTVVEHTTLVGEPEA
jgi:hypothetical protein